MKPRNPVACSPLLRKGGRHERCRSGQRQQARRQLAKQVVRCQAELTDHCNDTAANPRGANWPLRLLAHPIR